MQKSAKITLIALSSSGTTSLSAALSHPSRFLEKERMHCVKLLGMGFNTCNFQKDRQTLQVQKNTKNTLGKRISTMYWYNA